MKTIPLLVLVALTGCASAIPRPIQNAPAVNISLALALQEPDKQRGAPVRWGGVIATVENRRDESWIEIVDQPLTKDGYPRESDKSTGRFLARVRGFVDPVVFAAQRRVTVAGTLDGVTQRPIGEHPYVYPQVRVEQLYLWPLPPKTEHYYSLPYRHDPWYAWGHPPRHRHRH